MSPKYPLPGDTQQVLRRFQLVQCRNPGLLFSRFAPDWRGEPTQKRSGLEAVRTVKPDADLLAGFRQRWRNVVTALQGEVFEGTTDWRLVVGLGQKGPLEVGFTFHRLYGIAMIPGSALKGLARAYAYLVEGRDEADADFRAVFGRAPKAGQDQSQAEAGSAIFFDAIPLTGPELDLDVMNPHYQDYYQGNAPPADWQSPVPIYFLTLKRGIRFAFAVGWRKPMDEDGLQLRSLAAQWLQKGLQELGAGAKTSAGYGYFTVPEVQAEPTLVEEVPLIAAEPKPPTAPEPLTWRTGTVREYRPDRGTGRLVDAETGQEFRFERQAIKEKGWSPGKKMRVQYAVVDREGRQVVVKIRRV